MSDSDRLAYEMQGHRFHDEIDRLRAVLAAAEQERDELRIALATEKNEHATTEDWVRVADKSHGINMGLAIARAECAEASLAAAREVIAAISAMPNRNGFELRHYDLLMEAIGASRVFLERNR